MIFDLSYGGRFMKRHLKATVFCMSLAVPGLLVSVLAAQQPNQMPPAPVPAQILTAKKIFVANAGVDQPSYPEPVFSGGPDRAYNNFYAALKTWGRYELVGAPSGADLLFEIGLTARPGTAMRGATGYDDARFQLAIRDPQTNAALWALHEQVEPAILQGNRDKNFDQALARMVSDAKKLAAPSTAPASGPNGQ
jgi:hypothetical protein